jgi:hypothetical protein
MEKNKEQVASELKQQALTSWFRTWLWLYLEEKRARLNVQQPPQRRWQPTPMRGSVLTRFGRWLRTTITRPVRAWKLYRYAHLPQAKREDIEDAWLTKTLEMLRGEWNKGPRHPMPTAFNIDVGDSVEEALEKQAQSREESDFVRYLQGEIT